MKKLVLAVAALGLISLTSCKKDYTCTCTTTVSGTSTTNEISLGKQKKKDAESACSGKAVSTNGMTMKCDLK